LNTNGAEKLSSLHERQVVMDPGKRSLGQDDGGVFS